jgi:thiol-disulfide isomerase/thioredoxin
MKGLLITMVCLCVALDAKSNENSTPDSIVPGIQFVHGYTWNMILSKAKTEGKFVFIDCYTTWCGPCKRMDKEVYPLSDVGDLVNSKFISVKMQMDTAGADDEGTKSLYGDARSINLRYKIGAYPTLLFFNSEGQLLDKAIGLMTSDEFKRLILDALDPRKDYYRLLDAYKKGRRDPEEIRYLTHTALQLLADSVTSHEIAFVYISGMTNVSRMQRENIEFVREFTSSSRDIGFKWMYEDAKAIDSVMADSDYAQKIVHFLIYKELVLPEMDQAFKRGATPDWGKIFLTIKDRYNEYYAGRVILWAKFSWSRRVKKWSDYATLYSQFIEKYDSFDGHIVPVGIEDFIWNSKAWEIFKYSDNKQELNKALEWSNRAVRMNPDGRWIDTYANILYKLGYYDLAMSWEKIAITQAPEDKDVQENFEKMKKKEPTWHVEN